MATSQLDWYLNGPYKDYLTTSAAVGGTFTMMEAIQPAGDLSDPAVSDLVLSQICTIGVPYNVDFGAGRFSGRSSMKELYLTAPFAEADIVLDAPQKLRVVSFPSAKYAGYLEDVLPTSAKLDFGPLHACGFGSPIIANTLDLIWAVDDLSTPTSLLFAEGAALVILAELARLADKPVEQARGGLAPWAARRVVEYLHAHLAEEVSLVELAAVANLSPFHFARMFKRTLGVAPHAYQRGLRCERAKMLLAQTRHSVTGIAFDVGYESSQSFARMFRAETGMSPIDWRRHHFALPVWQDPEDQTEL